MEIRTIKSMKSLERYRDYYFLETYLFKVVSKKFNDHHFLNAEDFFAIVIWKSPRSKTMVRRGIVRSNQTIEELTSTIYRTQLPYEKLVELRKIFGIGMPIASAILTVCYPDNFTIVDRRARAALKTFGEKVTGDPTSSIPAYFDYLSKCKKLADKFGYSLRDFDRILWGRDFYEGDNGLKHLAEDSG